MLCFSYVLAAADQQPCVLLVQEQTKHWCGFGLELFNGAQQCL